MKIYRCLLIIIAFTVCAELTTYTLLPANEASAQSRTRRRTSRAKKPTTKKAATPSKAALEQEARLLAAQDEEQAVNNLDEGTLRAHVKFLSDDLMEGRGPGSRGGMLTTRYIAAQFEAMGLEPASSNHTFFQQVQMIGSKTDSSTVLTVKSANGDADFRFGDEFVGGAEREQTETEINGEIVFVGYGITAPESNWDDYKGTDVRGKILMIMVNDPPATPTEPELFGGKGLTYYGRWTYKYEEAARRGAAAVILIHTDESAGYGWSVVRNSWGGERFGLLPDSGTPELQLKAWVTGAVAEKIVRMGGQNLDQLTQAAKSRSFRPVVLNARVDMTLRTQIQRLNSPNVVAILRGSDPELKNEYVVYSSHWDHLGIRPDQPGDNIYNGAVDNATGIAGILAIAKAMTTLKTKPRRSVLFIATTAEEQGLLGAEFYVRNPLVPLEKTQANINLDSMNILGTTTDMTPLGAERSSLGKIIEAVAKEKNMTVSKDSHPEQGYFYRSDHFPFAKGGIPAVSFNPGTKFVGHSDAWTEEQINDYRSNRYHQPGDEYRPDWDFSGMIQQARLAMIIGLRVANADENQQWNKGDEFERARMKSLGMAQ